eukprot:CAMPEP_0119304756 /NCGR_PEP_ID=MMETSP1333-20130426/5902_1 /TAXON_ID=418940 /ORGANISM="Scyphosphaera apsteinii, Strain RCC1455" /LENGTH=181 /DNA_ID=CAMNT_0007307689 /DNA_START=26 /DNA_END=568 /DNA_ORIENTATION=-
MKCACLRALLVVSTSALSDYSPGLVASRRILHRHAATCAGSFAASEAPAKASDLQPTTEVTALSQTDLVTTTDQHSAVPIEVLTSPHVLNKLTEDTLEQTTTVGSNRPPIEMLLAPNVCTETNTAHSTQHSIFGRQPAELDELPPMPLELLIPLTDDTPFEIVSGVPLEQQRNPFELGPLK